jgi:hypothetical protein
VPQEDRIVPAQYLKDSNATLDYGVNWAPWLGTDTISASAWTVQTGLTTATPAPSFTTTTTTIWLSGGTVGTTYTVTNRVTTAAGRIDDRTFTIQVIDR